MRPIRTRRVAVFDVPDALRLAFALSLDVLDVANRAASALGGRCPFEVLRVRPGQRLPRALDALVLPGTGAATASEVQRQLGSPDGAWIVRTLARAHAAGVHIATSCAGVFFAAEAGVLDGRPATTSWFLAPELAARYPGVRVEPERILIESGPCLTGGAALAHAEVMLALVERLASPTLATHCASYLLLERRTSQRPYLMLRALAAGDPRITRAEAWVREHLDERFSMGAVAAKVGLGERTFSRLVHRVCGLSPLRFVQRIRIDAAREMLERGESFESVAPRVGYADASSLRRTFRRHARGRCGADGR